MKQFFRVVFAIALSLLICCPVLSDSVSRAINSWETTRYTSWSSFLDSPYASLMETDNSYLTGRLNVGLGQYSVGSTFFSGSSGPRVEPDGSGTVNLGATQCMGYAHWMYYVFYGQTPKGIGTNCLSASTTYTADACRTLVINSGAGIGAHIRFNGSDNSSGHSIVLLGYDNTGLVYIEGNYNGSNGICAAYSTWDKLVSGMKSKYGVVKYYVETPALYSGGSHSYVTISGSGLSSGSAEIGAGESISITAASTCHTGADTNGLCLREGLYAGSWSSSNPGVASVSDVTDSSGNIVGCTVTGISSGTAVISVRTKMNLTSSVTVTVNGSGELVEPDPSLGDDFADAALLFCKDNNFYGKTDIWFSIDYREAFGERAWGADFVSSVAKTFGAPTSLIPRSASAGAWSKTTQSQFHSLIADFHTTSSQYDYQAAGLYDPYYVVKRGDIVTLCWKGNTAFSNVGIVSEVDYANRTFSYVIGNVNGTVSVSSPMRFYQAYPGSDSSGDRVIGFFHPNWDELSSWRSAIPAESIFAFIKAMSLDVGDSDTSLQGMLEVKPDNAFCSTVVWSSSDTSVATVDKYSGVVTGAGVGTAVITGRAIADGVTDADGGVQWQAIAYVGVGIPHSGQCGENVFWELSDNCLHIYGSGPMYDYPTIYDSPWNNSHGISDVYSLMIDEGVDCAGTYAFAGLSSLSFITWPSAIEIHDSAFEACVSMAPLQLPAVSVIGQRAFYQCAFLSSVTIQDGTRFIGDYAFADDAYLNEIHIPASVEYIGDHVFDLNDNGDINPELIIYCDDNSLALEYALSKNISVRTNLGSDFNSFVLPTDTLTIGRRAFGNVPATAVRLPYGVRSIAANAFDMPFIQKIYIPSSVTSIDASAFGGQRSLRIYGMTGSYAETYAGQNGYTFIPLAEEPD